MGTDVHITIEKKIKTHKHGEVWATVNTLNSVFPDGLVGSDKVNNTPYGNFYRIECRNYAFFHDIANVRGEGEYQERGLPTDIAPLTERIADGWGIDGHSHSYLYADEMIPLYVKHHLTDEEKSKLFADRITGLSSIQTFHLIMERHFNVATGEEDSPRDYRFVFFFDN
jgi:hypothetical protein